MPEAMKPVHWRLEMGPCLQVGEGGSTLYVDGMVVRKEHFDNVIWDEVVVRDVYRVGELRVGTGRVVDVGAHKGYFAYMMRKWHPDCRVVCVEMDPQNLEVLRRNATQMGCVAVVDQPMWYGEKVVKRWTTDLGDGTQRKAGQARCFVGEGDGSKEWAAARGVFAREDGEAQALTMEEVLDHYGWDECDLVKLDCEGAEFPILRGMDAKRCWQIVGEFHGRKKFEEMMAELMEGKFRGWGLRVWEAEGQEGGELGMFRLTR